MKWYSLVARGMADEHLIVVLHQMARCITADAGVFVGVRAAVYARGECTEKGEGVVTHVSQAT